MKKKYRNEAVVISLTYAVFGIVWILLSDKLLEYVLQDIDSYKHFQTYKGWVYILITTLMVFILIRNRMRLLQNEIDKTESAYEQVKHIAFYDNLTDLPNRTMFENEINRNLKLEDSNKNFMIAYIDIDNFKNINDSMGHQVGDLFITYLGECLKAEVKEPDIAARLGGDEFAILYFNLSKQEILIRLDKIINRVSKTWTIENHQFYTSMSIGVVSYPNDGLSSTALLKNADIAMYSAKAEGKNRVIFYEESIRKNNDKHLKMINDLQYGIDEEQFLLYYQPQFDLNTGTIIGMEALVRWIHPKDGFISPGEFIPIAEESGQIYRLERFILTKALEQKRSLETQGFHDLIMSINLSGKTLTSSLNFDDIEQIIANAQVNLNKVVIEITETADISDVDIVIRHLNRLKARGLRIALDDFGTGYSSLNYLKKFPIDIIKLDRSFINAINEDGIDVLLIKNILTLAHDLEFEVVAEGIETKEQLEYLKEHLCEIGQGYLFSKPLPEERMHSLLETGYHYMDR
jgi:diguanylate cyclase (GGDEF)-like protein